MVKVYGNTVGASSSGWPAEAKSLLITILRASVPADQMENVNELERILCGVSSPDITTSAILGTGVLGQIILGRSA